MAPRSILGTAVSYPFAHNPSPPPLPSREGPEDLYWPAHTETSLPRPDDQLYPPAHKRVYAPEEMRVR